LCLRGIANSAGNKEQIQSLIENNIIPPLIQILADAEYDVRHEAALAISNAASGGNEQQIKFLVQQGCIQPLCDLLNVSNDEIIMFALRGLGNILKVGEEEAIATGSINQMALWISKAKGRTKMEDLQQHRSNDIYLKALHILETYYEAV
jgi:importin subunit alpha-6/7